MNKTDDRAAALLRHSDEETAARLAALAIPPGSPERARLLDRAERKIMMHDDTHFEDEVRGTAVTVKHTHFRHFAAAAACLLVIGGTAAGALWLRSKSPDSLTPATDVEVPVSIEETPIVALPDQAAAYALYQSFPDSIGRMSLHLHTTMQTEEDDLTLALDIPADCGSFAYTEDISGMTSTSTCYVEGDVRTILRDHLLTDGNSERDCTVIHRTDAAGTLVRETLLGFLPVQIYSDMLDDTSRWHVTDQTVYEGREVWVLEGTIEDDAVYEWTAYLDKETGFLPYILSKDADGAVVYTCAADGVQYGEQAAAPDVFTEAQRTALEADPDWTFRELWEDADGVVTAAGDADTNETCDATALETIIARYGSVPSRWYGYGMNSKGEIYGSCGGYPFDDAHYDLLCDLIAFGGDKAEQTYIRKDELFAAAKTDLLRGNICDRAGADWRVEQERDEVVVYELGTMHLYNKEGEEVGTFEACATLTPEQAAMNDAQSAP